MARNPDPARKPALLAQIIEYLRDKSISSLSFRSLAASLGVSTFTLVYHFGTRAELINEIVRNITHTQKRGLDADNGPTTLDGIIEQAFESLHWVVRPEVRHLERLELESAVSTVLDPDGILFTREVYSDWAVSSVPAFMHLGLSRDDATVQSRLLCNIFYGFQYDIVINGQQDEIETVFTAAMTGFRAGVAALMDAAESPTAANSRPA